MVETCRVLVVEPSDMFREFLDIVVHHAGYEVVAVDSDAQPALLLAEQRFDVLILASELDRAGQHAPRLARLAAERQVAVIVVLDDLLHRHAFVGDGFVLLEKPFKPAELVALLEAFRHSGAVDCEPRRER